MTSMRNSSSHYKFSHFVFLFCFTFVLLSPLQAALITTASVQADPNGYGSSTYQYSCSQEGASSAACGLRIPTSPTFVGGEFQASASASYGSVVAGSRIVGSARPRSVESLGQASSSAFFEDTLLLTGGSGQAYLQVVLRSQGSIFNGVTLGFLQMTSASATARMPLCDANAADCQLGYLDGVAVPISFGEPVQISMTVSASDWTNPFDGAGFASLSSSIVAINLLAARPDCAMSGPAVPVNCGPNPYLAATSVSLYQGPAYYASASGALYPVSGAAAVPEPSSLLLIAAGLVGGLAVRWRYRNAGRVSLS